MYGSPLRRVVAPGLTTGEPSSDWLTAVCFESQGEPSVSPVQ